VLMLRVLLRKAGRHQPRGAFAGRSHGGRGAVRLRRDCTLFGEHVRGEVTGLDTKRLHGPHHGANSLLLATLLVWILLPRFSIIA
jgi:hypothetical protein